MGLLAIANMATQLCKQLTAVAKRAKQTLNVAIGGALLSQAFILAGIKHWVEKKRAFLTKVGRILCKKGNYVMLRQAKEQL